MQGGAQCRASRRHPVVTPGAPSFVRNRIATSTGDKSITHTIPNSVTRRQAASMHPIGGAGCASRSSHATLSVRSVRGRARGKRHRLNPSVTARETSRTSIILSATPIRDIFFSIIVTSLFFGVSSSYSPFVLPAICV